MAKKKSKGFIVPSINFITMHRPAQSVETRAVKAEVKMPEETIEAGKNLEEKAEAARTSVTTTSGKESTSETATASEKAQSTPPKTAKPVTLEQTGNGRRKSALSLSSLKRDRLKAEEQRQKKAQENPTARLLPR